VIIRRRHTKNFTTIGNELFDDERLAADEVGILAYLLSRPDDWQVRRPALMRRWRYGDDRIKRVIHSLIRTGWCIAQKTRLSNGTFHIVYEIRDERGPALTDDEVKDALSLVSSEAAETPCPPPGQPGVGEPGVADTPLVYIESLPNTDSLNPESHQTGGGIWTDLQKAWPYVDVLSPLVCEKLFAVLTRKDQRQAVDAAGPYIVNCRVRNRKICDLSTYLKERRFDRPEVQSQGALCETKPVTPQAARWLESGQLSAFQAEQLARGRTITTPTEWPQPKQSTGPPDLMTPEYREELAKKWG
jgi:hypothetical protein